MVLLAGVSVEAPPGAGFDREPRIRAVRAKADAFVSGADMNKNFGRARDLRIDASPTFRAFVRFKVDVKSGHVERVSLLLFSHSHSRSGYQIRMVEEPWRERKITFLNAPSLSPSFIHSGPLKARSWKAVDVTSLVEEASGGEDYVSFALTTRSRNALELASRETGLHGPRLVVEEEGGSRSSLLPVPSPGSIPPD